MKKLSYIIILSAFALIGCNDGDSDFDTLIKEYESQTETNITPMEIAFNTTTLAEQQEIIPTESEDPEYFNDYVENSAFTHNIYIAYNGNEAQISGNTDLVMIEQDGAFVTIRSAQTSVCYHLSGQSSNGRLKIYSDHRFKIAANGLNLTNPNGAAINSQSGKTMYFETGVDGASLTDGTQYSGTPMGEDEKGTLFSEGQIVFSGTGQLTITSLSKNALASDDYVRFRTFSNVYLVSHAGHGIKANDGVFINGGVINIDVKANGMKGINCEDDIIVNGGRTTIITEGSTRLLLNDTTSTAAIKCDSTMAVNGGELRLLTKGDGSKTINVNQNFVMNGGNVFIVNTGNNNLAKAKGLKVDGNCTINGGQLYVYCSAMNLLDVHGTTTFSSKSHTIKEYPKLFLLKYNE